MALRMIETVCPAGLADTLVSIAGQTGALDVSVSDSDEGDRQCIRILADADAQQATIDALQSVLGSTERWRITVLPVEATLPRAPEPEKSAARNAPREELYDDIAHGANIDRTYLLLIAFSTVVAAMGLLGDNVAVVIGGMVIAPLLGPNVAFAFGGVLGDIALIRRALLCNLTGLAIALLLSILIGFSLPVDLSSQELMDRTVIGYDGMAIALASGAAAVLSLTTRLSGNLVGVMVAVALMPPTVTFGIMLAQLRLDLAAGALLLLAANIVCINLSAQVTFLLRGVRPRRASEQSSAYRSALGLTAVWSLLLVLLIVAVALQHS